MSHPDPARQAIESMFGAALVAADPRRAVLNVLRVDRGEIVVDGQPIAGSGRVVLIALGKAAVTMAQGAVDTLGDRIVAGIAITKDGHAGGAHFKQIEIAEAAHPIPDERGVQATRQALELVERAAADDLILALISGGGSALFEAPRPPVTLADMATVTNLLLRAGAAITELNQVRTPLSLVKGGGLAQAAGNRPLATLILSDVLGNDPRIIASGPTVPGGADAPAAREVLERFGLWNQAPESVRIVLRAERDEPASAVAPRIAIIADNEQAVEAASRLAINQGLRAEVIWHEVVGEARERGRDWADACLAAGSGVDCLLGGGEMTVTVIGDGVGGRTTEFALAAAMRLHEFDDHEWVIASLATDGQDGPTDVAGAILDARSIEQMRERGFDPRAYLERNDSLAPIEAVDAVVAPGPTGTNVNDLYLAVRRTAL